MELRGLKVLSLELATDAMGAPRVTLERVAQIDRSVRWAIRRDKLALGCEGEFEYEPLPSSRDEAFYARYRYGSIDDALTAWRLHLSTSANQYSGGQVSGL